MIEALYQRVPKLSSFENRPSSVPAESGSVLSICRCNAKSPPLSPFLAVRR